MEYPNLPRVFISKSGKYIQGNVILPSGDIQILNKPKINFELLQIKFDDDWTVSLNDNDETVITHPSIYPIYDNPKTFIVILSQLFPKWNTDKLI